MKYINLIAIFFITLLTSPQLSATTPSNNDEFCGNHMERFSPQCRGYRYLQREMFFAGTGGAEHRVIVHRMRNPNGVVVGMSLDFIVDTGVAQINNHEFFINSSLESFRSAFNNNSFYTYRECDPTIEVCCYDGNCFEIYEDQASQQNAKHELAESAPHTNLQTRNKGNKIREVLHDGAAIITWVQALFGNSGDTTTFREELADDLANESLFTLITTTSGGHLVCINTGSTCEVLNGNILHSERYSSADLYHEYGRDTNSQLDTFLSNWFIREMRQGTRCTQNMSCDASNSCRIAVRCQ